jgi:hypothetical protein
VRGGREPGQVSYLHCPRCAHAFNLATQPACPGCGTRPGAPADAAEDVIAAWEQLARAISRATPEQLASAEARLGSSGGLVRAARPALVPQVIVRSRLAEGAVEDASIKPAPAPGRTALLATVAIALLTRLARRPLRQRARALLDAWPGRA